MPVKYGVELALPPKWNDLFDSGMNGCALSVLRCVPLASAAKLPRVSAEALVQQLQIVAWQLANKCQKLPVLPVCNDVQTFGITTKYLFKQPYFL